MFLEVSSGRLHLSGRNLAGLLLAVLVMGTAALRLVWLTSAIGGDEAGYLSIASQWHPGTSVYGDYWVDRPPLLISFFALGHLLGGLEALRLLGCAVAGLTVLAAFSLGRALRLGRASALWPAAAAAAFISTPLFGVESSNGELLAVPLVLAGMFAVVRGYFAAPREGGHWWLMGGALGASACLVKQDFVDVFIFVGALTIAAWFDRSEDGHRVHVRDLGLAVGGAVAMTAGVLLVSDRLGTTPREVWDAVVVYRAHALGVLTHMSDPARGTRWASYPKTLLLAGVVPLLATFVVHLVRMRLAAVPIAAIATILWEIAAIVAGQEAWSHYLIGLTPGLVLAAALATGGSNSVAWLARGSVCYACAATLVAVATVPIVMATQSQSVGEWLRAGARPGDQAVVLLGQPSVVRVAGMQSPYQHLFFLPVMAEDPHFDALARVLSGPHAPEWVVVNPAHEQAARKTRAVLERKYVAKMEVCGDRVFLRRGIWRPIPPPPSACRRLAR